MEDATKPDFKFLVLIVVIPVHFTPQILKFMVFNLRLDTLMYEGVSI